MTSTPMTGLATKTAVCLTEVHKTYPNGPTTVPALRDISLTLEAASFTAIMGPSGSGKSTLLHIAAGLDSPTRGRVVIGGQDISTFSPDDLTRFRRDRIGFIFQNYNLIGHLSVADNIGLPVMLGGQELDQKWRAQLIASVGLDGLENRRPAELSGGQAQRVAIARALITRPTVVYADEPTGALDERTAGDVLDVLRHTAARLQQTVVIVTHDSTVAAVADSVVFLADGVIAGSLESPTSAQISRRMLAMSS